MSGVKEVVLAETVASMSEAERHVLGGLYRGQQTRVRTNLCRRLLRVGLIRYDPQFERIALTKLGQDVAAYLVETIDATTRELARGGGIPFKG